MHGGTAKVIAAAQQAIAARLAYERGTRGWYAVNPATGIVCGGPFASEEEATEDVLRRQDRTTVLGIEER